MSTQMTNRNSRVARCFCGGLQGYASVSYSWARWIASSVRNVQLRLDTLRHTTSWEGGFKCPEI